MNKNTTEPSYKPSLGKLFCEAANARFRINHSKSNQKESKLPYQNKTIFREVSLEKDDSKITNDKKSKCVIKITSNGLEATRWMLQDETLGKCNWLCSETWILCI